MINKQVVTNKQFISLVMIFLSVAGILFYFQLISKFVLLLLFWLLGAIVVIVFVLKLIDGVTDLVVIVKTKFAEAENGKTKTGNETDSRSTSK